MIEKKSPEWLAQWRSRIGGGRAAAAAGIHEYMTPLQLYESMTNGHDLDPESNENMLRGILMESVALERFRMQHPNIDIVAHDQNAFITNERYPFAQDLPDAWCTWDGTRVPIQVKVPTPRNWEKLDAEIPWYIQCNAVHSAVVNAAPICLLVCLHPVTMALYTQPFVPIPAAVDVLMQAEENFFNYHIVPRIPPEPRSHDDLKLRWPNHMAGKRVTATPEVLNAHQELMPLKVQAKQLAERIDDLSLSLKIQMADAEILEDTNGRVLATYRSHEKEALDMKKLKEDAPIVFSAYLKKSHVRTFLPKCGALGHGAAGQGSPR